VQLSNDTPIKGNQIQRDELMMHLINVGAFIMQARDDLAQEHYKEADCCLADAFKSLECLIRQVKRAE
jgi:hypothetical protein